MKYFSALALFLLIGQAAFTLPAFARPADPDRFPKYKPLRPAAPNVAPNYKGSINFSPEPAQQTQTGQDGSAAGSASSAQSPDSVARQSSAPPGNTGSSAKIFILFILLAAVLGYAFWRKKFLKKFKE